MKSRTPFISVLAAATLLASAAALTVIGGCRDEGAMAPHPAIYELPRSSTQGTPSPARKLTGDVEIVWNGGRGQDSTEAQGARRAFMKLSAHEPTSLRPGHGTATYSVVDETGALHRQIVIELDGARIDPLSEKAWYLGVVASDTKGCSGAPGGGHEDGCAGDTGGCTDEHDHTDGTCSGGGHDTGHDGGCSGEAGGGCGDDDHGDGGSPAVSGRSCRVGQYLVGKAHDGGTPGIEGDGITWKWFDADDPDLPSLENLEAWPHLCRKTILGGNLYVHTQADRDRGEARWQ